MKKGVYVYNTSSKLFSGVDKKIDMQIRVMSEQYDMHRVPLRKEDTNTVKSVWWRMPFGSYGRDYQGAERELKNAGEIHFFYIRHFLMDRRGYRFMKKLRVDYPNSLIVVEMPAYPYHRNAFEDISMSPFYLKDRVRAKALSKLVDVYTTFFWEQDIYGTPSIRISNGILVDEIDISSMIDSDRANEDREDAIHLLIVAHMQKYHGYERVIEGMKQYIAKKGSRKIIVDIVGDGDEAEYYKKLVSGYNLGDFIVFHGRKQGKDLESFYKMADIGLGSFGYYKTGDTTSSMLKMREYLAYGLPVMSGCIEDFKRGDDKCEFHLQVPNNATPVDMDSVVGYYDSLRRKYKKAELREKVHEYAKTHVDMKVAISPIMDYLKEKLN